MNDSERLTEIETVLHAAQFLDELKSRAAALSGRITPELRGYFTPEEEDESLGLLVSYWHTRNALLELIDSLRRDHAADKVPPALAFLIGFTAAVLLVDAARFLREVAVARPILRDKLNEPAPHFGIPPGIFDTIQKSLVSLRNGWHLLAAVRHYRHHIVTNRSAFSADAGRLLEIAESMVPQLDVTTAQFARAKLRTRASQVGRAAKHLFVHRTMYGLQRLAGTLVSDKYLRPGHRPGLPVEVRSAVAALLAPGDVLVVRKEYALTNYFLPGYWPHAALYLGTLEQYLGTLDQLADGALNRLREHGLRLSNAGPGNSPLVLEALKDGVRLRPLDSPFAVDSIVVLRPQLSTNEISQGLSRVLAHEGKPYDFDFDFRRSDRLVCTEVVYRAFDGLGGLCIPLIQRAGRPTLAGHDLIGHALRREFFDPIAVYAPGIMAGVQGAERAEEILRAATG